MDLENYTQQYSYSHHNNPSVQENNIRNINTLQEYPILIVLLIFCIFSLNFAFCCCNDILYCCNCCKCSNCSRRFISDAVENNLENDLENYIVNSRDNYVILSP